MRADHNNTPPMYMKKVLIVAKILVLFTFQIVYSQAPKYSNEFLQIGVGAKALGMSNASVAHVGDVTSGYWNPAGLVNVRSLVSVGLMHSEYFAGIAKYDYLGVAHALNPNTSIGLSIIRFGVDNIPNTTELIDNNGNLNYVKSFYNIFIHLCNIYFNKKNYFL